MKNKKVYKKLTDYLYFISHLSGLLCYENDKKTGFIGIW